MCYSVWGTRNRCSHCTSFRAERACEEMERRERINGRVWNIRSVPVRLELQDGGRFPCVLELVKMEFSTFAGDPTAENNQNDDNYLLFHDTLTGLLNEDGMRREARSAIERRDCHYVMILINIRRFRLVNDLFGKATGNKILMQIAEQLKAQTGEHQICGRVRADQFLLLVPEPEYSGEKLESRMVEIEDRVSFPHYRTHLQAAVYRIGDEERKLPVSVMIDRCRLAMDQIRDERYLRITEFNNELLDATLRRQKIFSDFPQDLENGAFTIYLQPQVDSSGRVDCCEALVRWKRRDGQIHCPGEFIPVLEESGLITKLDCYVWELAAKTLAGWKDTPMKKLAISVNVSPKDVYYIDVGETLSGICDKYGVPRSDLHIEITETGIMESMENQVRIIEDLHERGFSVEIDDFGKGLSSLSLLENISADLVKIDMGFLHDSDHEEKRNVILNSMIGMTKELGLGVLTEGVETADQAKMLEQMGCHLYQGYYFSRPVPVKDFESRYLRISGGK